MNYSLKHFLEYLLCSNVHFAVTSSKRTPEQNKVCNGAPKLFVRDALNVDISDTGRVALRKGAERISPLGFKNIWQSPLHKDVFATLKYEIKA